MSRKLLMLVLAMAFAGGVSGVSRAADNAPAAGQANENAKPKITHRGGFRGVVSEVGDRKFETMIMGSTIKVFFLDKDGKQMQTIGSPTGSATLTFRDGTTKQVTFAPGPAGKAPAHLMGSFQGSPGQPTQAAVQLSGLDGSSTDASYTVTFPTKPPKTGHRHPQKGSTN